MSWSVATLVSSKFYCCLDNDSGSPRSSYKVSLGDHFLGLTKKKQTTETMDHSAKTKGLQLYPCQWNLELVGAAQLPTILDNQGKKYYLSWPWLLSQLQKTASTCWDPENGRPTQGPGYAESTACPNVCCGPIMIWCGRITVKCYGILLTCLCCCTVHINLKKSTSIMVATSWSVRKNWEKQ